ALVAQRQQLPVQGAVSDVSGQPQYALGAQFGHPCSQTGSVDIGEQQLVAAGMAGARQLPAQTAGGAGDEEHAHRTSPVVAPAGARRPQNRASSRPASSCQQPQKAAISNMPPDCGKKVKISAMPSAELWMPVSSVTARTSASLRRHSRAQQ